MADSSPTSAAKDNAATTADMVPLKKGSLVCLDPGAFRDSLEAAASDAELPSYALEGPGEILAVKGDHAQIRWRRPVPDVWLRLDQLKAWNP